MVLIQSGESLPLVLKLYDSAADKYVRAKLFVDGFSSSTPYGLTHVEDGLYALNIGVLPSGIYHAVFEVFITSGYTVKDTAYSDAQETYIVSETNSLITQSKNDIINIVDDNDGKIATE